MPRTTSPTAASLPEIAIRSLQAHLSGEVIQPDDAAYDQARQVWNATVDRYPACIVRPADARDVSHAIRFARDNALPLAVRSGGHSPAGYGVNDGGLVIDLSMLKGLKIDTAKREAWAEPGLTWGEFHAQTHMRGLSTPGPDVANVGLGGHTLGGGYGLLSRRYGMTIDNLLAAEVLTADGDVLTASDFENADLFWALRGGGGNFGVATRFRYRLHDVATIVGGGLVYPATRTVIRDYVDKAAAAPDELSTITSSMLAPPLPFIPPRAHGTPVFMVIACYAGDLKSSEDAYAPLRNLGGSTPLADTIGEVPFPALYELTQMAGKRRPQTVRAAFMTAIDDQAIDAIIRAISHPSSPSSAVLLRLLGGEIACVPADATAFSHRDKPIYVAINNSWDDPRDPRNNEHVAWTESLWQQLAPDTAGAYANFLGDEGSERDRAAYSPQTFARLSRLKREYDPDNVFRGNVNIPPA